MEFMFHVSAFKQMAEPRTLILRIAWKVEHNRDAPGQQRTNERRQCVIYPGSTLHGTGNVDDLPGKEPLKELVLNQQHSVLSRSKFSRQGRLTGRHLSAHEEQLGPATHLVSPLSA
jgi:hypothetical protein